MKIQISNIASLPTKYGTFKLKCFKENDKEHLAIFTNNLSENPLVRVHSECLTGDALKSLKCDCGEQLDFALSLIADKGGMVIYLRQEGRNIGLLNKINAYALQDKGLDTVQANHQLGFKADERSYEVVEFILEHFGIKSIQLITNNPNKMDSLKNVVINKRVPVVIPANSHNKDYLNVKKEQMGHLL